LKAFYRGLSRTRKEDVDLSGLRTGVLGDGFGYVECGIFAALATACPPRWGEFVSARRPDMWWVRTLPSAMTRAICV